MQVKLTKMIVLNLSAYLRYSLIQNIKQMLGKLSLELFVICSTFVH